MNCFAALFLKFVHSSEEYCEHHEEERDYKKAIVSVLLLL